jgi:hypothetical protein
MKVLFTTGPEHVRKTVEEYGTDHLKSFELPSSSEPREMMPNKASWRGKHKSCERFMLPLLALVCSKRGFDCAIPVGRREYRENGDKVLEFRVDYVSDRKSRVVHTLYVRETRLGTARAARLIKGRTTTGKCEARILEIPPLIPSALWLRSQGRHVDRIIILESAIPTIQRGEVFTASKLRNELLPHARELLEFEETSVQSGKTRKKKEGNRSATARGKTAVAESKP